VLACQARSTECEAEATPVPEIATFSSVTPEPSLKATFPDAVPTDVGPKPNVNCVDCAADKLRGVVNPVTVNPGPERLAEFTYAVAAPTFARVIVLLDDAPTMTEPKSTDDGVAVNCADPAETAVPVSAIDKSLPWVSVEMARVPLITPEAVGENLIVSVTLCEGAKLDGAVKPDAVKKFPVTARLVIPMLAVPEFVILTDFEAVDPTLTDPKSIDA
jgi:hypothetical protein